MLFVPYRYLLFNWEGKKTGNTGWPEFSRPDNKSVLKFFLNNALLASLKRK